MNETVLPFPVLPDKTEDDARVIADHFKSDPAAYHDTRGKLGMTLERAYLQKTPMGNFVVAYVESERDAAATIAAMAQDDSGMSRFFREKVHEIHGVDMTQAPGGPAPETIMSWSDPEVTERRRGMAFCAPLVPDRVDQARRFAAEAEKSPDMTRSRRELGQNREVVTLHQTPNGPVAAIYLEGNDPWDGNSRFAASQDPFDLWFKGQSSEIFPSYVDFSQPVQGISEIFDSRAI